MMGGVDEGVLELMWWGWQIKKKKLRWLGNHWHRICYALLNSFLSLLTFFLQFVFCSLEIQWRSAKSHCGVDVLHFHYGGEKPSKITSWWASWWVFKTWLWLHARVWIKQINKSRNLVIFAQALSTVCNAIINGTVQACFIIWVPFQSLLWMWVEGAWSSLVHIK